VLSRASGIVVGATSLVVLGVCWWLLPRLVVRRVGGRRSNAGR
jgi:hypothetical protein